MIMLKSDVYVVKQILKKTTAKMFTDLKIGNKIMFSIPITIAGPGHNTRGGIYASYITVTNLDTKDTRQISFNQIGHILNYFKLIPQCEKFT